MEDNYETLNLPSRGRACVQRPDSGCVRRGRRDRRCETGIKFVVPPSGGSGPVIKPFRLKAGLRTERGAFTIDENDQAGFDFPLCRFARLPCGWR